jgi:hypothetical protein
MKLHLFLAAIPAVAGCGGGSKTGKASAPPPEAAEAAPAAEPEEPPPPPPPQEWRATASLTPVKGSKMKPGDVTFEQTEGGATEIATAAPLEGLKMGTYRLVVHEGAACGPNATKSGPAWPAETPATLTVDVGKAQPGTVDASSDDFALGGDASIVGRTLVLHEVKKGKLGKAVACGPITSSEPSSDE